MKFKRPLMSLRIFLSRSLGHLSRQTIATIIRITNPLVSIKDSEEPYKQNIHLVKPLPGNENFSENQNNWTCPNGFNYGSREIVSVSNVIVDIKLWNIFVEKRKLISESNSWGHEYLLRNPVPRPLGPTYRFNAKQGEQVVILSSNGFYHWMIEDLPKTLLLLQFLENPILVLCENPPSYVRDFVDKSGLKSIEVPRFVNFKDINFITSNNSTGWPRVDDIELLKSYFRLERKDVIRGQKVYVPRIGQSRSPKFEGDLISKLKEENWIIFDAAKFSLSKQIEMFSSATEVAGIHGAGLTGATWMAEGTVLHEISPIRNVRCFSRICAINKVNHNRIIYSDETADLDCVYRSITMKTK